jgi:hypothetical protein
MVRMKPRKVDDVESDMGSWLGNYEPTPSYSCMNSMYMCISFISSSNLLICLILVPAFPLSP